MNVEIEMQKSELGDNFINVIKFVRNITGWGLKESKDFTDALKQNHYYSGAGGTFRFTVDATVAIDVIPQKISEAKIIATMVFTPTLKELKGCFCMVSATKVHLYLENGDNKLSMVIDVGKMQDMIKMFTENCRNGG